MTLPVPKKTWERSSTTIPVAGSALANSQAAFRAFKDGVMAMSAWEMSHSSNSISSGVADDGVDYITSDSNVIWAAASSAHSWFVAKNNVTWYRFMLSANASTANSQQGIIKVAMNGNAFSDGSTTANPSATGAIDPGDAGLRWSCKISGASNIAQAVHVFASTDGECFRAYWCTGGYCNMVWIIDKPKVSNIDPTLWAYPSYIHCANSGSLTTDYPLIANMAAVTNSSAHHTATSPMTIQVLNSWNQTSGAYPARTAQNGFVSAWEVEKMQILCNTSGRGMHGYLQDLWLTTGTATLNTGDVAPASGTKSFVLFGDLWQYDPLGTTVTVNP